MPDTIDYAWDVVNPQLFLGRTALLRKMLDGLRGKRSSFGVAGARRMGKSTLLRRIEHEIQESEAYWFALGTFLIPVYVDGSDLDPLTAGAVWSHILEQILVTVRLRGYDLPSTIPAQVDYRQFKHMLQSIISLFWQKTRKALRIIILFDELDVLLPEDWSAQFLRNWRVLLSNVPGLTEYITAVFSGAQEITRLRHDSGSPLSNILTWFNLQLFDYEATTQLMCAGGTQWSGTLCERMYAETGGHPMLIQYLMRHISQQPADQAQLTFERAVQIFEDEQQKQLEQWWSEYCSPLSRQIYACLPDDKSALTRSMLNQTFETDIFLVGHALEILQHVGIVAIHGKGATQRISYAGEIFRRWYRTTYGLY
jgi:AAA+ ATPase superfamily predicted ATPase